MTRALLIPLLSLLALDTLADKAPNRERLNLWPIVYVSEEGFHAFGPIVKVSDDNFSLRPLFAVNTARHPRIRVLYPLSEINVGGDYNWIFPFFWGDNHRVAFPFYWRFDQPYSGAYGYHGILPLYSLSRRKDYVSLYAPWPFVHYKNSPSKQVRRIWPLYGHTETPESTQGYALWPLTGHWQTKNSERRGSYVFPLYYHAKGPGESRFFSLPWSQGQSAEEGMSWEMAFPFYYAGRDRERKEFVSLAWARSVEGEHARWLCPPLLSWGSSAPGQRTLHTLFGLAGHERKPKESKDYIAPLFYRHKSPDRDLFVSLPYSHYRDRAETNRWTAIVPFYFHSENVRRSMHATLLGGWQHYPDGRFRWDVYPLLTWRDRGPDAYHLWVLAPLYNYSREGNSTRHHLFPFYAYNEAEDRFLSLTYARWKKDGVRHTLIPPLLARIDQSEEVKDVWALAGLYRKRSSGKPDQRAGHLLPLYSYQGDHQFFTLLYGHDKNRLDAYRYYATPLVGSYTGGYRGFWVWPLYRSKVDRHTGYYDDNHLLFLGRRWKSSTGHGSRIFPFYSYRHVSHSWTPPEDCDAQALNGIKQYRAPNRSESTELNVLLLGHYEKSEQYWAQADGNRSRQGLEHRLFPLWSYRSSTEVEKNVTQSRTSLLLSMYTSRSTSGPEHEKVRRRLLWKLWDYRRENGEVQVDAFPFITYDRTEEGGKSTHFLWRLFRYANDGKGGRKLDLFFIPLLRT